MKNFLQRVKPFKGKFRIIRFLYRKYINIANDIDIFGKMGLIYRVPNLRENIGFELFANGEYETGHINFISKNIPVNGIFFDIGANIGSISIPLSKIRPDISIIAIEASPRVFKYLEYNVLRNNCSNISIWNLAISSESKGSIPFYSPKELYGKGSLSPIFTEVPEFVEAISIDHFIDSKAINHVDFIKVDVEGYENQVFKGSSKLLTSPNRPSILFEFSAWSEKKCGGEPGDAQNTLKSYGYELFKINPNNNLMFLGSTVEQGFTMIYAK